MVGEGAMSVKIDQYYDKTAGKTKFKAFCKRCNRPYPPGVNPVNAERHATRRGLNAETGLCKLCDLETAKIVEASVGQV